MPQEMRYIIRYTVICAWHVLIYNDHKIKSGATSDAATSPVAPLLDGLGEISNNQLADFYQADEQSGYIATPFDSKPKFFGHRSTPPLYSIRDNAELRCHC